MPIPQWKTGVYKILNKVTQKFYLGSAAQGFSGRWAGHRSALRKGKHPNRYLQASWSKHGEAQFEFLILETCPVSRCLEIEQRWLDAIKPYRREIGYNLSPTATGVLGVKWSEESRRRLSEVKKGTKLSEEAKANLSLKLKGHTVSKEVRLKISESHKTSEVAKAAREKKRGVPLSPQTRMKIRKALLGKKQSTLAVMRNILGQRKRFSDPNECRKVSERLLGNCNRLGGKNATSG